MTKTITILPQYSCQSDFPIDFSTAQEKANATAETTTSPDQKLTSIENSKPPSFWISKYQEMKNPFMAKFKSFLIKEMKYPHWMLNQNLM